jgi:multiple sugar transport system permease protein
MAAVTANAATATDATPVRRSTTSRRKARRSGLLNGVAVGAIAVWCLLPAYWMIVLSLRDPQFTFDTTPWPSHLTLSNYREAFDTTYNQFGRALLNSLLIGAVVTIVALLVGVFAAYALARLQFRGKFIVLGLILAASMFPQVALLTPLFQLFTDTHQIGHYQALIVPQISFALPLCIYILTGFFAEMPWELEQAAKVDGCTPAQAFRLVIFPLAAPGLFTTAILVFIASWNEFLLSYNLYNNNESVQPVTVAIAKFTAGPHVIPYTQTMAAGVVVTIPLVILVLIFQRRIVSGLTAGGVKG